MSWKRTIALGAVTSALVVGLSAGALAAGGGPTTVTVRVEGKAKTLLKPTAVRTHSGWITAGGVPSGMCSALSGQGALDVAAHRRWSGTFSTSLGSYFIKKILGESETGPKYYWSIFVNNVLASTGACGIRLHRGDTLLFAAAKYPEYPLGLIVPTTAHVGQTITGKVVYYDAKGKAKPVAGATVTVNGKSGKTGKGGTVPLTPSKAGSYTLLATDAGYIRSAPVTLRVS